MFQNMSEWNKLVKACERSSKLSYPDKLFIENVKQRLEQGEMLKVNETFLLNKIFEEKGALNAS